MAAQPQTPYEIIYQYIIDDTKRPDLEEIIQRRIRRALFKFHRIDMWKKDLIEQCYVFEQQNTAASTTPVTGANALFMNSGQPPALYIQEINCNLLTRMRTISYIRKWQTVDPFGMAILDPQNGQLGTVAGGDLTERAPDTMFDGYGYDVNDVFYRSGDSINIRSSTPLSQVYLGYFSDPYTQPIEQINSWIARDYPALIAAEVKAKIFSDIGKDEEKKGALQEVAQELAILQTNNVRVGQR